MQTTLRKRKKACQRGCVGGFNRATNQNPERKKEKNGEYIAGGEAVPLWVGLRGPQLREVTHRRKTTPQKEEKKKNPPFNSPFFSRGETNDKLLEKKENTGGEK